MTRSDQHVNPAVSSRDSASAQRHQLVFEPGDGSQVPAPSCSASGRRLPLTPVQPGVLAGHDHLQAHLPLGPHPAGGEGHLVVIARSEAGGPYDRLYVDADGTGQVAETAVTAKPDTIRGQVWVEFETTLQINHAAPGEPRSLEAYPIALWVATEAAADVPEFCRIAATGFMHARVTINDVLVHVLLNDASNDGMLGSGDFWELVEDGKRSRPARSRKVGDFGWCGGQAWTLELDGTSGRAGTLVAHDPGCTEAEDRIRRDPYHADRKVARAAQPVAFRADVEQALLEVAEQGLPYFLKFETDWCGSCLVMNDLVFTAQEVVDACAGITCIVVDASVHKELVAQLQVESLPTGILFDATGREVARYDDYQGVVQASAFFSKLNQ